MCTHTCTCMYMRKVVGENDEGDYEDDDGGDDNDDSDD